MLSYTSLTSGKTDVYSNALRAHYWKVMGIRQGRQQQDAAYEQKGRRLQQMAANQQRPNERPYRGVPLPNDPNVVVRNGQRYRIIEVYGPDAWIAGPHQELQGPLPVDAA